MIRSLQRWSDALQAFVQAHPVLAPLHRFLHDLVFRVQRDDCMGLASEMAYSVIMTLIPFLVFMVSLFGMLGQQTELFNLVNSTVRRLAPPEAQEFLLTLYERVLEGSSGELTLIGFLVAYWTASRSAAVVIKGMNRANAIHAKKWPLWYRPAISLLLVAALSGMLFLAVNLIIMGHVLLDWLAVSLALPDEILARFNVFRWLVVILGIVFLSTFVYALLLRPKNGRLAWRPALPGTLTFVVLWILISQVFGFYVGHLANINPVYGTLGVIVILASWLYFSALSLFIGGEVAAMMSDRAIEET